MQFCWDILYDFIYMTTCYDQIRPAVNPQQARLLEYRSLIRPATLQQCNNKSRGDPCSHTKLFARARNCRVMLPSVFFFLIYAIQMWPTCSEMRVWLRNRWFLDNFLQFQVEKISRVRFNYTTILPRPGLAYAIIQLETSFLEALRKGNLLSAGFP